MDWWAGQMGLVDGAVELIERDCFKDTVVVSIYVSKGRRQPLTSGCLHTTCTSPAAVTGDDG